MMQQLSFLPEDHFKISPSEKRKLELLPDQELLNGLSKPEILNWANYLYSTPRPETTKLSLRNHIVALYDPFALRKDFPAGRRWCVNVYTGCAFSCKYCYTMGYIRDTFNPRIKKGFERLLLKDLSEIQSLNLHPAPIHISNSTDPLQYLERTHHHTLSLLKKLKVYEQYFTTITILTKNPALLCTPEYLEIIKALKDFQVEVTCPYFNDEVRKYLEPKAPKIETRLRAIRKLRKENVTVALRIDPIFPRDPLPKQFFDKPTLKDYGAPSGQTEEDIMQLIHFASDVGCSRIIVSPLKLVVGRFDTSELISVYRKLYAAANNGKIIKKGSSYRIPWPLYHHWIETPTQLANSLGLEIIFCKKNLFTTP